LSGDIGLSKSTDQLARLTSQGLFWNFLAYGTSKGVVLFTTSILARILSKDDFGLVAVALVAINYLSIIKDLGLGAALIQRRSEINKAASTVFTVNLFMGVVLSILVIPIAPLFAHYFQNPQVTPVIRWLGLSFLVNAIGSVHIAHLQRDLNFKKKMVPDIGNAIIRGIVSIFLATKGFGVWAIVYGQLSGAAVSTILVWIIYPWFPKMSIDLGVGRELIKFGASIMGTDAISVTTENIDTVIAGRIFGLTQLSIYSMAYRLPEMLLLSNLWVMGGVLFPAFSAIQNQPSEMRKGFLASIRLVELIAFPVCLIIIIATKPIVLVLFGDQWLEVVPVLRVLGFYAWVYSVGFHVGGIYKATGRPDILFKLSIISLGVIFPALLIGANFGLVGIAYGQLIAMLIRRTVSLSVASRLLKISIFDMIRELKPAALAGTGLAATIIFTLWTTSNMNPFLQLFFIGLFGGGIYLLILWLIERENIMRLFHKIFHSQ
jgi:O-antigen/teichoic acid export membrane protein